MKNTESKALRQEMDFRLSLLRLMTVPHQKQETVGESKDSEDLRSLAVLLPRKRK